MNYTVGLYHPAPDMRFKSLSEVWKFIEELRAINCLVDVVCCNDAGDILDAPYDNSMIPGIIEEKVGVHSEPRRWILQS